MWSSGDKAAWQPGRFPGEAPWADSRQSNTVLYSDKVLLRPWQVEDARWYVDSRDEEVFRWTTERRDLIVSETEEAIRHRDARVNVYSFAVVDPDRSEILGNVALVLGDEAANAGEVMYWLAPWGRGRGVATRAVALLCQWAFDVLHLERITLKTHLDNLRSQMVAERVGFRKVEDGNERGEHQVNQWFELAKGWGLMNADARH